MVFLSGKAEVSREFTTCVVVRMEYENNTIYFQWVNPDLPALGSTSRTGTCDQAKPIKVLTVRSIFEFKAELIHLNVLMCSRNIQYGAAHDVALLSGSDRMNDDEIVFPGSLL